MGAGSPFRLVRGTGLPAIVIFFISIESIGLAQYTTTRPATAPTEITTSTGTFSIGERYDTVRSPTSQPGVDRVVLPNGVLQIRSGPPTTQQYEVLRQTMEQRRAAAQRVAAQPARSPTAGSITDVFTPTTRPATMPAGVNWEPFTLVAQAPPPAPPRPATNPTVITGSTPGRGAPPTTAQAQVLQARAAAQAAQAQAIQAQVAQLQLAQGQLILQANPGIAGDPGADGFSIRKGDPAAADALAAFEAAAKEGTWEKAFAAMTTVLESPSDAMVRRSDGFYLSSRTHVQQMLSSLPPAGREAYRLFNDATARRALARIDSPTDATPSGNPITQLQNLFDRYFITSIGDQIADRLGDAKFESGDFTGAAACWGAVLMDYPDTSLSKARIATKRVIALSRAGRRDELQAAAAQLREKYADQTVRLGGRDVAVANVIDGLPKTIDVPTRVADPSRPQQQNLMPKPGDDPAWHCLFMDDNLQDQIKRLYGAVRPELGYSPQAVIPDAVVAGDRVYLNWLGVGIAIDGSTGKLLWRSESFAGIVTRFQQMVVTGYDNGESSIAASNGGDRLVLVSGSPTSRLITVPANLVGRGVVVGRAGAAAVQPMVRMSARQGSGMINCYSTDGAMLWGSDKTAALNLWAILGEPLIVNDVVYVAAMPIYGQSTELNLLAISLADGDVRWKLVLGTMAQGFNQRGLSIASKPVLRRSGDTLYVLTGNGAMLSVNLPAQRIDWAFTYDTTPRPVYSQFGVISAPPGVQQSASSLQLSGSMLYFKEKGSNTAYAIDASGPSLKWNRRVDGDTSVLGAEASSLLFLGDELTGVDLTTREMQWSVRTPLGTRMGQPLVSGSRALVYGSKGLYGVDLQTGAIETFNTYERGGTGGTVLRLGDRLICVSSRSVTAYAIPTGNGKP